MECMQRQIRGPVVLWCVIALAAAGAVLLYGAGAITAVSGLVAAVLACAPFAPAIRRWWLRADATSTAQQLDAASHALRNAARMRWMEEAGRRRHFHTEDRMAVTWQTVAPSYGSSWGKLNLPDSGSVESLVGSYADFPTPLVVVGDAGAGKTALCVLLALELASREAPQPVPIMLQLSSWNPSESVETWIQRKLVEDYPFLTDEARWGRSVAQDLLVGRKLLLILDGLDELAADVRAAFVKVVRESPTFASPFVLASRTEEFDAAVGRRALSRTTVLLVQPLGRAAVGRYLRGVFSTDVQRWQPVIDEVERDPSGLLATTVRKPLMLFLARAMYEDSDTDPAELLDKSSFTTGGSIEHHLLDRFIPTVFARHTPPPRGNPLRPSGRFGPDRAESALRFLAGHLAGLPPRGSRGDADLSWWRLYRLVPFPAYLIMSVVLSTIGCGGLCCLLFGLFGRLDLGLVVGTSIGVAAGTALSLVRPEPPLRFVPRPPQWMALGRRSVLQDLGFGLMGAVAGGVIADLLTTPAAGVSSGLVFGAAFALARRFTRPTEPREAVTPIRALSGDRSAVLYGSLLGAVVGFGVGALLAVTDPDLAGRLIFQSTPVERVLLGGLAGLTPCAAALGMMVLATGAWGRFLTARTWLWVVGATPLRLMTFLDDAHKLGVLRQTGPHYQFRHALLQERLAQGASEHDQSSMSSAPVPTEDQDHLERGIGIEARHPL